MNNNIINNREKVLITGGSGLVGRHLTFLLLSKDFDVVHLSRKQNQFGKVRVFHWDPDKGILDPIVFEGVDYIVHLAGANIGEKRWTKERKEEIVNSRVESAKLLYKTVSENGIMLKAFITASAIGYYGALTSDKVFSEDDPPGDDFLGTVCRKWEEAADRFKNTDTRVVKIRTAVVIDKNDNVLSKFLATARFGLFPKLSNGKQYLPWIHMEDLCGIYLRAIQDEKMEGAYNAVSPQHINQSEFMRTLASVLNRPFFHPPVPAVLLKAALGEMSEVVLNGSKISSEKITLSGHRFLYPELVGALQEVLDIHPTDALS